jgi:CheY-like chemotaxis protein
VHKLTREQFQAELRDALNHLQDPSRLRHSPLADLFGVAGRRDSPSALRSVLVEAIASLKPPPDAPVQSHAWRNYECLFYRHVQQFSQAEIAVQLGVSDRHLRREQSRALETLANQLWEHFALETEVAGGSHAGPAMNEELAWMKNGLSEGAIDLNETLSTVADLAGPLAARHGVRVELGAGKLPKVACDAVVLRQMLLSLLGVIIPLASGDRVVLTAESLSHGVKIDAGCTRVAPSSQPMSEAGAASLDMVRQMAGLCGAELAVTAESQSFQATLTLPTLGQLLVLVIDDNAGTLQLFQRYTIGTRYRLVGTRDQARAVRLAEKLSPQVILLDVMMPRVDGWEILGRLRHHPATQHIPVVACTILAEEELAISLGASAFMRKPVTQEDFLAVLDRQIERLGKESR